MGTALQLGVLATVLLCCSNQHALCSASQDGDMQDVIFEMKEALTTLREEMDEMKSEMQRQKYLENEKVSMTGDVGFLALASGGQIDIGDVIQYEVVISNIGNAYDPNTGTFRCPVTGMYLFSSTLWSDDELSMRAMLKTTQKDLVTGDSALGYNTGMAGPAVIPCAEGEIVWVEGVYNGDVILGERRSYFTGALLGLIV